MNKRLLLLTLIGITSSSFADPLPTMKQLNEKITVVNNNISSVSNRFETITSELNDQIVLESNRLDRVVEQLSPAAFSGNYNDLINTPTNLSDFTNDLDIVEVGDLVGITNSIDNLELRVEELETAIHGDTNYDAGLGISITNRIISVDTNIVVTREYFELRVGEEVKSIIMQMITDGFELNGEHYKIVIDEAHINGE